MRSSNGGVKVFLTGQSLIKRDVRSPRQPLFRELMEHLDRSDIRFTNYEGTIRGRHGGWPMKNGFIHASPPEMMKVLKELGFNAFSLANNHAFDLGPPGILSTLDSVRELEVLHAGIGEDRFRASRPGKMIFGGLPCTLIALDCSPNPDCFSAADAREHMEARPGVNRMRMNESLILPHELKKRLDECSRLTGERRRNKAYERVGFRVGRTGADRFYGLKLEAGDAAMEKRQLHPDDVANQLELIRQASKDGDFVIVSFHHHYWEPDWQKPPAWLQKFLRACVDHGAHLVIGHGVPILQGIEIYKNQPIFYSTGNFIYHTFRRSTYSNDSLWKGLGAFCTFDTKKRVQSIRLYPFIIGGEAVLSDHQLPRDIPMLCRGEQAADVIRQIMLLSESFGTKVKLEGDIGMI